MAADECSKRIRRALRAELDKRWGRRKTINEALGHGIEYLGRVCRGVIPIKLDELLAALELMDVDVGRFFADALGTTIANDWLLEDLESSGEIHRHLLDVEKATVQLELSEPLAAAAPPADVAAMVAAVAACAVTEQRRRLATARKYRHPAFIAAFLEHLDSVRYDDPQKASQIAVVVAVKLIPRSLGSQRERMMLQLEAIGILASAHRQKGSLATAARALRFSLALARLHGLQQTTAELLQRGAYVLSGNGHFRGAMKLLDEALVISFDLDSQQGLARVLVDRGSHLYLLGEYSDAVAAVEHALKLLHGGSRRNRRNRRNRVVAHQVRAHSFLELGDLGKAAAAAARAVTESEEAGGLYRAYLLWDHGVIALERRDLDLAEKRLREASRAFVRTGDPNQAMVALDLTKILLARGEPVEARSMAVRAAEYLATLRGNKIAAAAVTELMRTANRGSVSLRLISRAQAALEEAGAGLVRNPLQRADRDRPG